MPGRPAAEAGGGRYHQHRPCRSLLERACPSPAKQLQPAARYREENAWKAILKAVKQSGCGRMAGDGVRQRPMTLRAWQRRLQAWPGGGGEGDAVRQRQRRKLEAIVHARASLSGQRREQVLARCSASECLSTQKLEQQGQTLLSPPFPPDQLPQAAAAATLGAPGAPACLRSPPRPGSSRLPPGYGLLAAWPWLQPSTTNATTTSSSSRRLIRSTVPVAEAHSAEAAAGTGS